MIDNVVHAIAVLLITEREQTGLEWNANVQGGFMKNEVIMTEFDADGRELLCPYCVLWTQKSCMPRNSYFLMIKM